MNPARLRAQLALAVGAVEVRLRLGFPRLMWALTLRPPERDQPFAELVRIESGSAYRALFFAELGAKHKTAVDEPHAAAGVLRCLVGPARYAVDVTVTDGRRVTSLGGGTLPNRRLAIRWLRRQALRLADGHGHDMPPGALRLPARDVDPVVFHGSDAPERLRSWAGDDECQNDAIRALESGLPAVLTVTDPAVGMHVTLAGWPVRSTLAVGDTLPDGSPRTPLSPG
ncbi:hypothetical protein [Streptomyces sp. NPDC059452]|uniref:hypothetical protein n=1 Tax=Streptomyces sp. NPDC059452 TaxID=3346835 RepID=UPI0036A6A109